MAAEAGEAGKNPVGLLYSGDMNPRFRVQQKITPLVNRYFVLAPDSDDVLAFAQQKRFKFREEVIFYDDTDKSNEVFRLQAEKIADVHGRFNVTDTNGSALGGFRKEFKKSLLRSSWVIYTASGEEVARVRESSQTYAVIRRVAEFIPFIDEIFAFVGWLIKYHFELVSLDEQTRLGTYRKTTMARDHYELSSTEQLDQAVDWRVLAAMAVALDALQDR